MRRLTKGALLAAGLLCALSAWILVSTEARFRAVHAVPTSVSLPPADAALRARGEHLLRVVGQCTSCHGPDLAGASMADDVWLGRLDAPNLTPGRGGLAEHRDADIERALRHGVGRDGRALWMMPANHLAQLSDRDVTGLVAALRALPPLDRTSGPKRAGPFTRVVLALGLAPDLLAAEIIDHEAVGGRRVPPAAEPEYGEYLVTVGGCRICHGQDLRGGLHPLALPGEPPPPDLTPASRLAHWTEADFVRALRSGSTPDGRRLDPTFMPWPTMAGLTDLEVRAIWRYLQRL
jgi:mono/diheme cytochrome c family protein